MVKSAETAKAKATKARPASGRPTSSLDATAMALAQLKPATTTKKKKLKLRYSNILRAAKDWFSKDPMNTKDSDKLPPGTVTINNISDFVKNLFGEIEFDPSDVTRLDSSNYKNLAMTVGLLFREHGGDFDAKN